MSARKVFAAGRRPPGTKNVPTVRRCQWCGEWPDGEPEGPYVETTTMCADCKDEHFPEEKS